MVAVAGLSTSASLAVSSGAFSNVSTRRTVAVDTAADDEAYLKLDPISDTGEGGEETGRAYTLADETIAFSIPGVYSGESESVEGVGANSVYTFSDLFRISNQGTDPVKVWSSYDGETLSDLALVHEELILRDSPLELHPGDGIDVGLYIDSRNTEIDGYEETLTINAEQPDD